MISAFFQPDGNDPLRYKDGKYDFSSGNKLKNLFEGEDKLFKRLKIAEEKYNGVDYLTL